MFLLHDASSDFYHLQAITNFGASFTVASTALITVDRGPIFTFLSPQSSMSLFSLYEKTNLGYFAMVNGSFYPFGYGDINLALTFHDQHGSLSSRTAKWRTILVSGINSAPTCVLNDPIQPQRH